MTENTPDGAGAPTGDDDLTAWAEEQRRLMPPGEAEIEEAKTRLWRVLQEITAYCEGSWDRDVVPAAGREVVADLLGEDVPDSYVVTPEPSPNQKLRRELLEDHYGWRPETIRRFRLGFDDGGLYEHLRARGLSDERILLSGHFYPRKVGSSGPLRSRFEGRLLFPFLDNNDACYFAARATSRTRRWSKADKDGKVVDRDPPKYLKSRLHRELSAEQLAAGEVPDGISPYLANDCIYNAADGNKAAAIGVVAEGAADLISIAQAGWPVISPVAVTFRREDADRLLDLTSRWKVTVLVPDQEENGAGVRGAVKTADVMFAAGRDIRIAVLPHEHLRAQAEARVADLRAKATRRGSEPTEAELDAAGDWKVDANEFLSAKREIACQRRELEAKLKALQEGAGSDDQPLLDEARRVARDHLAAFVRQARKDAEVRFRALVEAAMPYLDYRIASLPDEIQPSQIQELLAPVLALIATRKSAVEREAYLQKLRRHARISNLRKMAEEAVASQSCGEEGEESAVRDDVLGAIVAGTTPLRIATGRVFGTIDGELLPVEGAAFVRRVAATFKEKTGSYMTKGAFEKVVLAVVGGQLPSGHAPIRYADDGQGGVLVDLARGARRAVHITARGVGVVESPVAFFRPDGTLPLPDPEVPSTDAECVAVLNAYYADLLGLQDEHGRAACFAYQVCAMRPMEWASRITDGGETDELTEFPALNVTGPKGSGKTTLAREILRPIDPRRPDVMALPKTTDDLAILAENGHVIAFDNLSSMTTELSDALCRLSTGDGFKKRSLYSDRDLSVFRGSRPVACTGIVDFAKQADLLDRQLILRLPIRSKRTTKRDFAKASAGMLARVFGALCYCVHRALGATAEAPTEDIRMFDAAMFAAGAEALAGLEVGAVFRAFTSSRAEADRQAAEDPVVDALLAVVPKGGYFEGPTGGLLDSLTEERRGGPLGRKPLPREWPKAPRGLTAALKRLEPALRSLGLVVEFPTGTGGGDDGKSRVLRITRLGTEVSAGDRGNGLMDLCCLPTVGQAVSSGGPSEESQPDPRVTDDPTVPTVATPPSSATSKEEWSLKAGAASRDSRGASTLSSSEEEREQPSEPSEPSESPGSAEQSFRRSPPDDRRNEIATPSEAPLPPCPETLPAGRYVALPKTIQRFDDGLVVEFVVPPGSGSPSEHLIRMRSSEENLGQFVTKLGWRGERDERHALIGFDAIVELDLYYVQDEGGRTRSRLRSVETIHRQ